MAINVQYGPISQALGLAAQSGQGINQRQNQAADMAFLEMVRRMQADADARRLSEIQMALGTQETNARLGMAAQQHQDDMAFRQQQLAAQTQEAEANRALRQQGMELDAAAMLGRNAQAQAQRTSMQQYIEQLPAGPNRDQALAYFNATGKLPETVVPQNPPAPSAGRRFNYNDDPEIQRMKFELDSLRHELSRTSRAKDEYASTNIGAAVGKIDPTLQGLLNAEQQVAQRVQAKEQAITQRMQQLTQSSNIGDIQVAPAVIQQIIQQRTGGNQPAPAAPQSAPDQQPRIVKTGTDQATGRRVGMTETGQVVFLN